MSYIINDYSEQDFNSLRPINTNVVIKLPKHTGETVHEHKSGLLINSAFSSDETYSPCHGVIVKKGNDVDRRVQEGDTVFFHYLCYINARNTKEQQKNGGYDPSKSLFEYGGDIYLIMGIDNVYFVKRGEELVSINDFVLLKPIPKNLSKHDVTINNHTTTILVEEFDGGIVGAPQTAKAYRTDVAEVISAPEDCNLIKGDIIAPPKDWDVPLEYDMIAVLKEPVYFLDKEYAYNIKELGLTKESLGIA